MVLVLDWAFSSWLSQLLLDHLLSPSSKIVLLSLLLCSLSLSVCVSIWGGVELNAHIQYSIFTEKFHLTWVLNFYEAFVCTSVHEAFDHETDFCISCESPFSPTSLLFLLMGGGGWGMVESSLGWKLGDLDSISRFATNCLILDILSRHYFLIYTTRQLK